MKHLSLFKQLFLKQPLRSLSQEIHITSQRSIGLFQLTMLGVGATIGAGIFVIMNEAVPIAGPAITLSFLLAGITAGLTALCYAELSSMMPGSGSSYSYTYATLGELPAYLIAACLMLEYGVSAATVAVGCSQYINQFLQSIFNWEIPAALASSTTPGSLFNLPAVLLVVGCCFLLLRSVREFAFVSAVIVMVKIVILGMFIAIAFNSFHAENLQPFMPHGISGIGAASASVFFSYIGIDAVSTAGNDVRNPSRNLPLAIVFTLILVTTIYGLTALAAVGAQPYTAFQNQTAGMSVILQNLITARWPSIILTIGAIVSIFSVTLIVIYGQTRMLMTMSHDGMLPKIFAKTHTKTQVPVANTLIVCFFVALLAALFPLHVLAELTCLGTLVIFFVVSLAVLILRKTQADIPRKFRVPFSPFIPLLSLACCLYLIANLPQQTYRLFAIWLGIAGVIYFLYSFKHSKLQATENTTPSLD